MGEPSIAVGVVPPKLCDVPRIVGGVAAAMSLSESFGDGIRLSETLIGEKGWKAELVDLGNVLVDPLKVLVDPLNVFGVMFEALRETLCIFDAV